MTRSLHTEKQRQRQSLPQEIGGDRDRETERQRSRETERDTQKQSQSVAPPLTLTDAEWYVPRPPPTAPLLRGEGKEAPPHTSTILSMRMGGEEVLEDRWGLVPRCTVHQANVSMHD